MSLQYEKPEEENAAQPTPEEFLARQKAAIRRRSLLFLAGGISIGAYLLYRLAAGVETVEEMSGDVFFILALFGLAGGAFGFYYAKKLTLDDLIPSPEAAEFLRSARGAKPYFTIVLIVCLVTVSLVQISTEYAASLFDVGEKSANIAGLVKPLVFKGEYWRILTAATLHGFFPLHLYFNSQALYGFGSLVEQLSNRAHLAIVFVLAIVVGGLFSLFFMPGITSIGASGGVMGLIGYMAVYGYRRRRQMPPDFLKTMLINIGFIAAFGLVAYKIVDNFAHFGGLAAGAAYAFFQVPKSLHKNPRAAGNAAELLGYAALGVFIFVSILTALLLLRFVEL